VPAGRAGGRTRLAQADAMPETGTSEPVGGAPALDDKPRAHDGPDAESAIEDGSDVFSSQPSGTFAPQLDDCCATAPVPRRNHQAVEAAADLASPVGVQCDSQSVG
jgi:hypothetical protein